MSTRGYRLSCNHRLHHPQRRLRSLPVKDVLVGSYHHLLHFIFSPFSACKLFMSVGPVRDTRCAFSVYNLSNMSNYNFDVIYPTLVSSVVDSICFLLPRQTQSVLQSLLAARIMCVTSWSNGDLDMDFEEIPHNQS